MVQRVMLLLRKDTQQKLTQDLESEYNVYVRDWENNSRYKTKTYLQKQRLQLVDL